MVITWNAKDKEFYPLGFSDSAGNFLELHHQKAENTGQLGIGTRVFRVFARFRYGEGRLLARAFARVPA
jgi:hypothetical protein